MDKLLGSADLFRREFWRATVWIGLGPHLVRDRHARLTVLAGLHMSLALLLTVVAPVWLLLLAPLVLGVPHVFADIRYLILRPPNRTDRGVLLAVLIPLLGMSLLRILLVLGILSVPRIEVLLGLLSLCAAVVLTRGRTSWQLGLLLMISGLTVLGMTSPRMVALGMAHLHNLVAFGLWVAWSRSSGASKRCTWAVGTMFLGGISLLASGVLEPFLGMIGGLGAAGGLTIDEMTRALAPGLPPAVGLKLVLIFAFAQSVHYVVWLRLIPGSEPFEPRGVPTTFRHDLQGLVADFGPAGVGLAIGLTLAVPIFGLLDPTGTREAYLSIVFFHGWLEIAMAAHWFVRR